MNRVTKFIMATLLMSMAACRPTTETADTDLSYVRELGYRHAELYRKLTDKSTEMQRQDFLLNIQALETRLADEVGEEYAHTFRQAFADSAFVKQLN